MRNPGRKPATVGVRPPAPGAKQQSSPQVASYDGLDPGFRSRLMSLIAASGGRVWLVSGHRTVERQKQLWDAAVKKYGSEAAARRWVAPPGRSNHNHGIAGDLGGDLALAHKLAPQFGLSFPMSHEPWHVEPTGARVTSSPDAYTTPSPREQGGEQGLSGEAGTPGTPTAKPDYMAVLAQALGAETMTGAGANAAPSDASDPYSGATETGPTEPEPTETGPTEPEPTVAPDATAGDELGEFMAAVRAQESDGDYRAVGAPTRYGRATGAYQFLDSTWGRYKGYARAADAPPAVQDERARQLMGEYLRRFGSLDAVAAAWFSGEGGKWSSPEVQEYVASVMRRIRRR